VKLRACLSGLLAALPQPMPAQDAVVREAMVAAVEAAAPAALAREDTPGVGVAIVLDGALAWSGGFGLADVTTGQSVTADTPFEIASLTKPVTAWAMLKLAEEGRIDLDAPIETYLDGWHLPPSGFDHARVTARAILAHGAGLGTGGDSGVDEGAPVPTLLEAAGGATMEYGAVRVERAPGQGYHYSSKGFVLLEMAVEIVTGERYATYVQREVLAPLGMADSAFGWTPELELRGAWGHDWYGRRLPHYRHATQAQGGLVATPGDVARFVAASMASSGGDAPGRGVISAASVAQTFTPFPFADDTATVGLGYNLHTDGPVLVARKGGDHRGYKAMLFSVPEAGLGLVILANSDRAAPGLFADIACPWSAAAPGSPLRRICGQLFVLKAAHWAVGGVAALAGGIVAWRVLRGLRRGTRARTARLALPRVLACGALVLAISAWWVFWYSDLYLRMQGFPPTFYTVRATLWPTAFVWVSSGVSALLAALMLPILFPRASRLTRP